MLMENGATLEASAGSDGLLEFRKSSEKLLGGMIVQNKMHRWESLRGRTAFLMKIISPWANGSLPYPPQS
jgi:hypothetical protein